MTKISFKTINEKELMNLNEDKTIILLDSDSTYKKLSRNIYKFIFANYFKKVIDINSYNMLTEKYINENIVLLDINLLNPEANEIVVETISIIKRQSDNVNIFIFNDTTKGD